jgi:hypothetical protein
MLCTLPSYATDTFFRFLTAMPDEEEELHVTKQGITRSAVAVFNGRPQC